MKIASILSIVALIASMATNGCSEDGPVTNPRQEEPQKVVKEEVPIEAKRYAKELMEEVNTDREAHGKKPFSAQRA